MATISIKGLFNVMDKLYLTSKNKSFDAVLSKDGTTLNNLVKEDELE